MATTTETLSSAVPTKPSKDKELPRGIRRRGNSLYVYLTRPDGRPEVRAVGNVTPAFAQQQRNIWQRELTEARYVKPVPRASQVTFSAIADAAVEHAKNYKRTWDADQGRAKLLKRWWGTRLANEITTQDIDTALFANLAPRGLCWSETTSNEYRATISHFFKLAIDRGELSVNPTEKAHRYKLNNCRTRELSSEEETRLRAAVQELYPSKEVELDLLLHTGARCSNWYGISKVGRKPMEPLQWDAINLDWKIVTFPRSKSGSGYQVPLNQVAVDALAELLKRSKDGKVGPVIRKPSGLELQSCRKWFEKSCEKAGILDLRPHDLRHTFATRLRRNRTPIEDIAALLGHDLKQHSMTARYAHVDLDVLRTAVEKLVPKAADQTGTKTGTGSISQFPRAESA